MSVGLQGTDCRYSDGQQCMIGLTGVCMPTGLPGKTGCPCIEIHQDAKGAVGPVEVQNKSKTKPSKIDKKSQLDVKAATNRIEKHDPDVIKKRLQRKNL
uniref:Uncharacterized protein n=1 Tax=viral metagenome TaxID=1070528 RepID=A0A6C0JU83_9ZZZZ